MKTLFEVEQKTFGREVADALDRGVVELTHYGAHLVGREYYRELDRERAESLRDAPERA